ncbi:hypothetical protein FJZ48_04310 [Candidatus Uhrbacteria bacterium]|nr:hypothetical protein [Candidatus Uhrbacteria bacterium]
MFLKKWTMIISALVFAVFCFFQNPFIAYAAPGTCYLTNKNDESDYVMIPNVTCETQQDCKRPRENSCIQSKDPKVCSDKYELSCYKESYCWCQRNDKGHELECENHTEDDKGRPIQSQDQCIAYCGSRGFKNTNYDTTRYIERVKKSTIEGKCPEVQKAQPAAPAQGSSASLYNPLGNVTLQGMIARVIRAVIGIVGALALLAFVYGGFVWMTAGGSEKRVAEGRTIIINAVIGLLIIFFSYTLTNVFLQIFAGIASS